MIDIDGPKTQRCETCDGTGSVGKWVAEDDMVMVTCPDCGGWGWREVDLDEDE